MTQSMRSARLVRRSLLFYWRTNLAVIAGVATAVAVLSGALLVGRSVQDSLRSLVYQRLGTTEYALSADRFFREELADAFSPDSAPIIYLQGAVIHEGTRSRAHTVNVYGVDDRFWHSQHAARTGPIGREALLGASLAEKLGAGKGDSLLLRIEAQQGVAKESLFGRRENSGRTVRLTCGDIITAEDLGEYALRPSQGRIYSIFLPLGRLQKDLDQPGRANSIVVPHNAQIETLRKSFSLEDLGIRLKPLPSSNSISVESSRILLDQPIAEAAFRAASDVDAKASGIYTYLANSIRAGGREIPYSVISAWDSSQFAVRSSQAESSTQDGIWLNEWAWRRLGVALGDTVEVDYYVWLEQGRLEERTARFRLSGVVPIGGDVGPSLAPDFPGITGLRSIASWDPPFPLDLNRIRPEDEEYWNQYTTTPKAFISLAEGQELWQTRFGRLSAVRVSLSPEMGFEDEQARFARALRGRINPEQAGFTLAAVRRGGLNGSKGSTDFGEYFVYFSFFLIASAILLAALFFKLGIEQRVRELGALQAAGFSPGALRRLFLLEGASLSAAGTLLGLFGAVAYGRLMVLGLRTWWVDAVGTRQLAFHLSWTHLGIGAAAGIVASLAAVAWTLRDLGRNSPRALLAGVLESTDLRARRAYAVAVAAAGSFLAAVVLIIASGLGRISSVEGFFGAGFLLLVSLLSATALHLRRTNPGLISGRGWRALLRLGTRSTMHRPGRSLLCVALIASASFIIVSVEAFRHDPQSISLDSHSGTGGYALMAESALPIVYDPNTPAGREAS